MERRVTIFLYGGDEGDSYRSVDSNGNDTYLFGRGSGQDTIIDYDKTAGNLDTILLNNDVLPTDVAISRDGDNLLLSINDTADTLTVNNWFKDESGTWQVEQIQFADGATWNADDIKLMVLEGTPGDDILIGYSTPDTISGLAGNDLIYGEGAADILDGGPGNDYIEGGAGDDTYLFGRGSGQDVIFDYDTAQGNMDTISLGADVLTTDISLQQTGDNLVISINGATDTLQLTSWFADATKIERLQFSDGTVWDAAYMEQMVSGPSEIENYIYGTEADDILYGGQLNDAIYGYAGNDRIFGLEGDDQLFGGDSYDGRPGRRSAWRLYFWRTG